MKRDILKLFDFGKTLVLVPHRDDECLGMGGTLLQCAVSPYALHLHYFNHIHPAVAESVYDAEAEEIKHTLNCHTSYSKYMSVNRLNEFPLSLHISELENLINIYKPDTMFIPFKSYNQDHRHVFEVAITASRVHDRIHYVKNILVYEEMDSIQTNRLEVPFIPQVFVPIDIEGKIKLFQLYQSQQREHRSVDRIKYLAGVRGAQCNAEFAEAFEVIRLTV